MFVNCLILWCGIFSELKFCVWICSFAIIKAIYGDSNLVIKYWSQGNCKSDDDLTKKLSNTVTKIKNNFNGSINHISGDINPADLGFHK